MLIGGAVCVLLAVPLAIYAAHGLVSQYPDGPAWTQRLLDMRMARAVAAQRIIGQTLEIDVVPGTGALRGTSILEVECGGSGLDAVFFVLNPGLKPISASWGGVKLPVSRQGGLVRIGLREPLGPGERGRIQFEYAGLIANTSLADAVISLEAVWLPWEACWHPVDFSSFVRFDCTVTLGGELQLAGIVDEAPRSVEEGGRYRVKPARAQMGLPLVAGRFAERAGVYGDIHWAVHYPPSAQQAAESWAGLFPGVAVSLRTFLGPDHANAIHAVLTNRVARPAYLGSALVALPLEWPGGDDATVVHLAAALSRNWWGGTVSPSWYPAHADGGAWLLEGLATHSGWAVLDELRGRTAAMEYIEQQHPKPAAVPLRTVNALELARMPVDAVNELQCQGAHIARWFESSAGRDAYWEACRNVCLTHGGNAITLEAFRHALTLTSEKDLNEMFRVWFDRAGALDYGVGDVRSLEGKVQVTLTNHGDIPALQPVTVCIVTARGVDLHHIEPGASGGAFTFGVDGAVDRVVLDPYFETPDMARGNNIWPRRDWPKAIAVSSRGAIAVALAGTWESPGAGTIRVMHPDREAIEHVRLPSPLTKPLLWSPEGHRLAFGAGRAYVCCDDAGVREVPVRDSGYPIGWLGERLLVGRAGKDNAGWAVSEPPYEAVTWNGLPARPVAGTVAFYARDNLCAFVAQEDGSVWVGEFPGTGLERVYGGEKLAGAPVFSTEGMLRFFVTSGLVVQIARASGCWTNSTLVELGHGVENGRLAPDGSMAAWQPAGGRLVVTSLDRFEPRNVRLEGPCMDFAWQDTTTLVCLTRENEWSLPGRFHAAYRLRKVNAVTGETETVSRFPGL